MTEMYVETWWKCRCPRCAAVNWLCVGDVSDLTGFDPHALECRSCGEVTVLDPYGCADASDADLGLASPDEDPDADE